MRLIPHWWDIYHHLIFATWQAEDNVSIRYRRFPPDDSLIACEPSPLSCAVWFAVCSSHPYLFVCLTVPQRAPLSRSREQTAFTFFPGWRSHSDVYVVLVICCHSLFCCRSPMARLQSWQERSPTGTRVERLSQSNINIWPAPQDWKY